METNRNTPEVSSSGEGTSDSKTILKNSKKKNTRVSLSAPLSQQKPPYPRYFAEKSETKSVDDTRDLFEQLKSMSSEKTLPKEATEMEAPLEQLGAEEKRLASSEVVKERQTELNNQESTAETDTPDVAADEASQLYLDNLHDKLNKFQPKELTAEEAIDLAARETELQVLGVKIGEDLSSDSVEDTESQAVKPDSHEYRISSGDEIYVKAEDDPIGPLASSKPLGTGGQPNADDGKASPSPNVPPAEVLGSGGIIGPGGPNIPNAPAGFNSSPDPNNSQMPAPAIHNTGPTIIERNPNRDVGMFFAGAIVGYFLGRRRGRIKTEKRLKPIQKKLEGEVHNLSSRIAGRENHIRRLAYSQAYQEQLSKKERSKLTAEKLSSQSKLENEKTVIPQAEKIGESALAISYAVNAKAEGVVPTERLQDVLSQNIHNDSYSKSVRSSDIFVNPDKSLLHKEERLTHSEILDISEKIDIDNVRLSDMYRSDRIDNKSLRLLVVEYLRGGDVKKLLDHELKKDQSQQLPESVLPEVSFADQPPTAISLGTIDAAPSSESSSAESNHPVTTENQVLISNSPLGRSQELERQHRLRATTSAGITIFAIILISSIYWVTR